MDVHTAPWPIQEQQPFEMIVAADVVTSDLLQGILPRPVRMPAEGERNTIRVACQDRLQGLITREGLPKQTVRTADRLGLRKVQACKRRMMRDDDNLSG